MSGDAEKRQVRYEFERVAHRCGGPVGEELGHDVAAGDVRIGKEGQHRDPGEEFHQLEDAEDRRVGHRPRNDADGRHAGHREKHNAPQDSADPREAQDETVGPGQRGRHRAGP